MVDRPPEHSTPKGAASIDALTDMAIDMFLDQGYEAVSLDALITRAGGLTPEYLPTVRRERRAVYGGHRLNM